MDDYLEFIDDLRFLHLDELNIEPKNDDPVTFSSSSTELSKREYMPYVFKLCCLRWGHAVPELSKVSLDTPDGKTEDRDLSEVIEPLRIYLLSSSSQQIIITCAAFYSSCVELLAEFGDKALRPGMTRA